jgi:hypothetical protein
MVQRQDLPCPVRNVIAFTPPLVCDHHDACELRPHCQVIRRPRTQHLQQTSESHVKTACRQGPAADRQLNPSTSNLLVLRLSVLTW